MKKKIKLYLQELKFNLVYLKNGWVSLFETIYKNIRLNFWFYLHKKRIKKMDEFDYLLGTNYSTGSSLWGINSFMDKFHNIAVYKFRDILHKEDLENIPKSAKFLFT